MEIIRFISFIMIIAALWMGFIFGMTNPNSVCMLYSMGILIVFVPIYIYYSVKEIRTKKKEE